VKRSIAWNRDIARAVVDDHKDRPGAMLPILHGLQETFGYIHKEAVPLVADALNVSGAEVHGVVTFYHDFHTAPPAAHVLKLCRAEACQAVGGEGLAARAHEKLGVSFGKVTADGRIGLEPVYCLGLCSVAPSAMFDGRLIGRLDTAKLDAILAESDR
jgi:formate dehydrogenase subunit gamma